MRTACIRFELYGHAAQPQQTRRAPKKARYLFDNTDVRPPDVTCREMKALARYPCLTVMLFSITRHTTHNTLLTLELHCHHHKPPSFMVRHPVQRYAPFM